MEKSPASPRTAQWKWLRIGAAVALCATLTGCFGATPLPKRTRTPEGTEVKSLDLTFIHPGQTTRNEVKDKLKLIDTGYSGDRFFLGRWSSSSWGGWMVAVGIPPGGFGGGGRVWKSGNLLVEFDEQGIVKRSEPFNDTKALRVLAPVAEDTPLQLTPPVELQVKYLNGVNAGTVAAKIVLSPSTFDFEELGDRKRRHKFSLPAKEVVKVEIPVTMATPDATYSGERLRCALDLKKLGGPRGKDINLQLTLPQLVMLMSYVSQAAQSPSTSGTSEVTRK